VTEELAGRLTDHVLATSGVTDDRIAAALRAVPRHLFLPHLPPEEAYRDDAIVTKRDADGLPVSSSSQPTIMAIMLAQLGLAPGHRVLEIGAGTGYNAALIRHIVGPSGAVVSVDIDPELTQAARGHLASAGYPDVTVACTDGAGGWPDGAPYDRVIAAVGVSDLAPAWVAQAAPAARIVVPLDVRGMQLSVAFERAGEHWSSRSLVPCGFMRMRGTLTGPERTLVLQPSLFLSLPDRGGASLDPAALAAALAGPRVCVPAGVHATASRVTWELGLWLAASEPRLCRLEEELPTAGGHGTVLTDAPLRGATVLGSVGIVAPGGIAVLTATPPDRGELTLEAAGFGPDAAALAADLADHVRAWDRAGQPGAAGLHVDAYPRAAAAPPPRPPPDGALLIERPGTSFIVYRQVALPR
jgi:protein-L-isoaspartate(D-aspartate) O-methyltransferase